jgi:hypothetical protein
MLKTVGFPSTRTGDQTIVGGSLIVGTAGEGVDFSANANAPGMTSELLDWYEEGTFTPTVAGSTTVGTASYGRQTGRYTRIGNLVTFSIDLDWNSGTGTGDLRINGLPFTSASGHNTGIGSSFSNFATTANNIPQPWIAGATSQVIMQQVPVGGGAVTSVAYVATGAAMLFGSYNV